MAVSTINEAGLGIQAYGNRSLIINGAMNVDQRNSGSAVTAHNAYAVDRFQLKDTSSGAASMQQISGTRPDGFKQTVKISCTTADTSFGSTEYFGMRYKVEGHDAAHLDWGTSAAQTVTLSFYVRSNLTGTWGGVINDSSSSAAYAFTYTIDAANTFERKTITIPGPTIGSWSTDNSSWGELWFAPQAGSNWTASSDNAWNAEYAIAPAATVNNILSSTSNEIYFTGVQLEVGDTATPFEHRSYGDELARCQRYYQVHTHTAAVAGNFSSLNFSLYKYNVNRYVCPYRFSPHMRTGPTVTFSSSARHHKGGTRVDTGTFSAVQSSAHVVTLLSDPDTNDVSTSPTVLFDGGNATIEFDAEL